jgi:hypothetical protein
MREMEKRLVVSNIKGVIEQHRLCIISLVK